MLNLALSETINQSASFFAMKALRHLFSLGSRSLPASGISILSRSIRQVQHEHPFWANLEKLAGRVAEIFGIETKDLWLSGKYARTVFARSVFCYWAVRELGLRETEVARRLKLTQPAVCISVRRGEHIAKERRLDILGE